MTGYWFAGTGSEAGAYADSIALKDENGLPYFPGKSLKGIFRNAFKIAENNNWFTDHKDLENFLFGKEGSYCRPGESGKNQTFIEPNNLLTSGHLHFSNAVIDPRITEFVLKEPDLRNLLFKTIQNTAINSNGVADATSLRSYEVVVPLRLMSEISYDETDDLCGKMMLEMLRQVSALIMDIGGKRRRGFGRCIMEVS